MTKYQLASAIESHHLYCPATEGSKNYYRYSPSREIDHLMKKNTKEELKDIYDMFYSDGRELSSHEVNW